MHKLILGIIAVAFIQIGFITFVALDTASDNASNIVKPPFSPFGNTVTVASLSDEDFNVGASDVVSDRQFSREVRRSRYIRTRVRSPKKVLKTPTQPFVPGQIIITYAVSKPYKFIDREPYKNVAVVDNSVVNKPEIAEQPVTKVEKRDDNPLVNIVKKPFGWIKALGSKLK